MLAAYAVRVENSRGRRHPEPQHPYRNDFQRDRDRVIHSRSFRRLEAKTQVFTRRYSDHFRNRLTHTIEVAQISRTIAAQLGLNVDLVEALALVHDIRHSDMPERRRWMRSCDSMACLSTITCTRSASLKISSCVTPPFAG